MRRRYGSSARGTPSEPLDPEKLIKRPQRTQRTQRKAGELLHGANRQQAAARDLPSLSTPTTAPFPLCFPLRPLRPSRTQHLFPSEACSAHSLAAGELDKRALIHSHTPSGLTDVLDAGCLIEKIEIAQGTVHGERQHSLLSCHRESFYVPLLKNQPLTPVQKPFLFPTSSRTFASLSLSNSNFTLVRSLLKSSVLMATAIALSA